VVLRAHGKSYSARRNRDLILPAGQYSMSATPVRFLYDHRGTRHGDLAYALGANGTIRLEDGQRTDVTVDYGTVRSRDVQILSRHGLLGHVGPKRNPRIVILARRPRHGRILVSAPSRELPLGVVGRVARVRPLKDVWEARLTPAKLTDVFRALNVDERLGGSLPRGFAAKLARSLNESPGVRAAADAPDRVEVTLSLPNDDKSTCHRGPSDPKLTFPLRFDRQTRLQLDRRLGLPVGGEWSTTMSGSADATVTVGAEAECEARWQFLPPKLIGVIFVGEVPVPITISATAHARIGVNGALSVSGGADYSGTFGLKFGSRGNDAIRELSVNPHAPTIEAVGTGSASAGVTVTLAAGVPKFLNAHLDGDIGVQASVDTHRNYSVTGAFSPSAGLSVGPFNVTVPLKSWELFPPLRGTFGGQPAGPSGSGSPGNPNSAGGSPSPASVPTGSGRPVLHYDCPNDNSNIGHYVPSGRHWSEAFTAQGTSISRGHLQLGANADGGDHRARIGIYSAGQLAGPIQEVVVPVVRYTGVDFQLPQPLVVTPGQRYYLTATGVGDFTAYDNRAGCFIGRLEGTG
jgi:hypothetical protein